MSQKCPKETAAEVATMRREIAELVRKGEHFRDTGRPQAATEMFMLANLLDQKLRRATS